MYAQLQGADGRETAALKLDKSGNDFERGKVDEFRVMAVDVGDVKRLKIWHDGSGAGVLCWSGCCRQHLEAGLRLINHGAGSSSALHRLVGAP